MAEDIFDEFNPFNYLAGIVSFGPNTCRFKGDFFEEKHKKTNQF